MLIILLRAIWLELDCVPLFDHKQGEAQGQCGQRAAQQGPAAEASAVLTAVV